MGSKIFPLTIFYFILLNSAVGRIIPKFRILAPQFVCSVDEDGPITKPENTFITIQATDLDLNFTWTVRWKHLDTPTQRFTIMLWKSVRNLENKLNQPQSEANVYVINNSELLNGVEYIFNVTSHTKKNDEKETKTFSIDNIKGDKELLNIEGRGDMFSIILLGGQIAYADVEFVIEALVTTCYSTQDYFFVWTVQSEENEINVAQVAGSRLEIAPYSLETGLVYDVNCQIIKRSTNLTIAQTGLPIFVARGGIEVYLTFDKLIVPLKREFSVASIIINHDCDGDTLTYEWQCILDGQILDECNNFENGTITFTSGLPTLGRYEIVVTVTTPNKRATANATVIAVEADLPLIQMEPIPRVLNEGGVVTLVGNITNVTPSCAITWYFATEQYLNNQSTYDRLCEDCQYGEPLTNSLKIYSKEETFLFEITDFANETEWRQTSVDVVASAGRAALLVQCGCSLTFDCTTEGSAYAEINLLLNPSPKASLVFVFPDRGTALESLFRISTQSSEDPDLPLRCSFYCRVGTNDTLLLGSFVDHFAIVTILPFMKNGTIVWVKVCDARGACSNSNPITVHLSPGEGHNVDVLLGEVQAHIQRCEMMLLRRLVVSTIVTYKNTGQSDVLIKFVDQTSSMLHNMEECDCTVRNCHHFWLMLDWLANNYYDN